MTNLIPGFGRERPVIGVLHLPPLPGSPNYEGHPRQILDRVHTDASALVDGGVDGILLENFGDTPFYPKRVPRETVAWMTRIGSLVRDRFSVPLGICVLRNDGRSALAIAHSIDAQFVRVCILAFPRVTDQGIIEGIACDLLRDRARLHSSIKIFADVDIKHSYPLGFGHSIEAEAADLVSRSHADALIVTGAATGAPIDSSQFAKVRESADVPVLVGSGVTSQNISVLLKDASGVIVGSAFKRPGGGVDVDRVRCIVGSIERKVGSE